MTVSRLRKLVCITLIIFLSTLTVPAYAISADPVTPTGEEQAEEPTEPPVAPEETPSKPILSLDKITARSLCFKWECESGAEKYLVYVSDDNGETCELISTTTDTFFRYDSSFNAVPGKKYSFFVAAVNGEISTLSEKETWQLKKVSTAITKINHNPSRTSRYTYKDRISVNCPAGRTLSIQLRKKGKWITVKSMKLGSGFDKETYIVRFPNKWWKKEQTRWRYVINKNSNATAFRSRSIILKTKKYYQNPSKYVQLKNRISAHGYRYYTAPVLTDNSSSRKEHINAMIRTAYKYLGDRFVVCRSRAPGKGVDCSGLVMQACYGAGADLWPSNPQRHRFPRYEYESRNIAKMKKLKTVPVKKKRRGDLIFFSKRGVITHVAIYLGKNRIIHSYPPKVMVTGIHGWGKICKVKRIFN